MFRIVARLRRMALAMPRRSPFTRVTPALCMATSVPVPMAMPTSASLRAGASLMPSPAIATCFPSARSFLTWATFPAGSISASTASRPSCLGHRSGGTAVVAGEHDEFQPERVEFGDGFGCSGFDRVGDSEDSRRVCHLRRRTSRSYLHPEVPRPMLQAARSQLPSRSAGSPALPTITARPAMTPATPPAVTERKSFTASRAIPCSFAPWTIAAASGCSLFCSSDAARRRSSFVSIPADGQ